MKPKGKGGGKAKMGKKKSLVGWVPYHTKFNKCLYFNKNGEVEIIATKIKKDLTDWDEANPTKVRITIKELKERANG